ncbi:MAG: type IV secretory system conjugative DNA transfer family protein [Lachnospiraceae bacterium]|nr:type IV secretory system conjugative DNA transfer family protein [Lachnospiraceae bacterium]
MENDGSATRAYQSQSFDILNRSIQSSTERQSVALDDEAQEYEKRLTERGDEDILVSGAERYERKIHPVRSRVRKFLRRFGATLCKLTILICAIGLAVDTVRLVAGGLSMHPTWLLPTPWMVLWIPPLAVVLIFGNLSEDFNFHRPKKIAFYVLSGHLIVSVLRCTYLVSFSLGMYFWAWIPVHPLMPSRFVWILAMYWILFPVVLVGIALISFFDANLWQDLTWIYRFRFANTFDIRPNRKNAYDANYIYTAEKKKVVPVFETDRMLHTLIVGPTGSGKTALTAEQMFKGDLAKRVENDNLLRQMLEKMVRSHHATVIRPIASEWDWRPEDVRPEPGYEDEYYYYILKYRPCGLTLVAPDSALADKIYALCRSLHIPVNRIEPVLSDTGERAEGWTGFNPLYISPSIPSWMLKDEIVRRATLVADVIGAINEGTGSDQYFLTVNRSLTIAMLVELLFAFPYVNKDPNRTCPTLEDFLYLLGDFSRIAVYNSEVLKNDPQRTFQPYVDFIAKDMLAGYSSEKSRNDKSGLWSQSRGLRTNVQNLLAKREFREILCSPTTMDIDHALAAGEVTLVNYAYNKGQQDSAAFAGFFLRCFFDSVYRRPGTEQSRVPHFLINDEASITLETVGAAYERAAVLFRKYRVSMTLMIQSLSQLDKTHETAYAKGVLLSSCSTQIVFGRIPPEEMKLYSELGGTRNVVKEQHTVTQTALTVDDPTASMGTREMLTEENNLEGTDVRYQDFTYYTVFTVRNGTPLLPFTARSMFRKKKEDKQIVRYQSHFVELSGDAPLPVEPEVKAQVEESAKTAVAEESFTAVPLLKNEEYQAIRPFSFDELDSLASEDAENPVSDDAGNDSPVRAPKIPPKPFYASSMGNSAFNAGGEIDRDESFD